MRRILRRALSYYFEPFLKLTTRIDIPRRPATLHNASEKRVWYKQGLLMLCVQATGANGRVVVCATASKAHPTESMPDGFRCFKPLQEYERCVVGDDNCAPGMYCHSQIPPNGETETPGRCRAHR